MKFLKIFLCISVFLGSISGVYASEDSGTSEALKIVKERVDTKDYTEFKSSYYKEDNGDISYYFYWSNEDDNGKQLYIDFSDGVITSYGKYDNESVGQDKFSLSDAEAEEISKEFIKRINPDIYESIKIVPEKMQSIHQDQYDLKLYRQEAEIPVLNETGYMSVSKSTKEVSGFYINYTRGLDFKNADNVISEEDAKAAYKKLIPPTLRYKFKRDYRNKEITAYLEYAQDNSVFLIDAQSGGIYKMPYDDDIFYSKNMAAREDSAEGGSLTPAELEETERIAGLLTEEEASGIAKSNEIIAIPQNAGQEYASLNRNWFNKNEYIYEFGYSTDKGYVNVSLDAKTGEILSFYKYSGEELENKQDRKNEEKKAKDALKVFAGDKASEFYIEESEYEGTVSFIRTVNGLDAVGNGAYFDFDDADNITGYRLSYTKDVDFPSADGVISLDTAAEYAFDALGFELGYAADYDKKTAQPVYYIGKAAEIKNFTMNPFSGHITDYKGDDLEETEEITYSDIDGHYGKQAFLALADYGIGIKGGELKPDEPITQAEYVSLLNKAFGYEAEIDEIYKRIIQEGVITASERADDSPLTRENAAIFMIREMGAEDYAKYNDIFAAPFDDVTENKGYVAILKAKGIISGAGDGNFYPQNTVTRGEALIMIYNYFSK